jgi:hypothetical protein
MKLDLLTNATVVDDAIRFVTQKGAVANAEPKSGADEDRLEEKQEERTGDITAITNQVF